MHMFQSAKVEFDSKISFFIFRYKVDKELVIATAKVGYKYRKN